MGVGTAEEPLRVAIGVAGFAAIRDHRGRHDREGRVLVATEEALADELAAAAGVLQAKAAGPEFWDQAFARLTGE